MVLDPKIHIHSSPSPFPSLSLSKDTYIRIKIFPPSVLIIALHPIPFNPNLKQNLGISKKFGNAQVIVLRDLCTFQPEAKFLLGLRFKEVKVTMRFAAVA
jgi:hypothetical protein